MELVNKYATTGGGGQTGFSLVLPGGDKGSPAVWSRFLSAVGCNNYDGVEYQCGVSTLDHIEVDETSS